MDIIAFASGPTCNWFWGSHGCSLEPGHDGLHLCGTPDDPCSKHSGTQVLYHYVGGDWATDWLDSVGYCTGDGIQRPGYIFKNARCPHPEHCSGRDTWKHRGW